MKLDELTDPQKKTRAIKKAVARGKVGDTVKNLSKEKEVDKAKALKSEPAGVDIDSSEYDEGMIDAEG